MIKYPDLYIMTDSKDCVHKDTAQAALLYLVQTAQSKNAEDVLPRLIVQCYNYDYIDWAREVYPFENYLFTMYRMGMGSYVPLITEYCDAQKMCVVTMPYEWYLGMEPSGDHNPPQVLCLHTVNDKQLALQMRESGADIFYTDFLLPEDFAPAA